ncbi:putative inorganic phosphate cotransporter [Homalodisca vitripennis]|uniref:putative inorganic phosphate cotransporter n=1 Tax=Homalodisca vitripennis TaxID=197043 RepID=UPI001EE9D34F|nr:putative inorganic phosphate cotransporter [Homalodisca vitripennis]
MWNFTFFGDHKQMRALTHAFYAGFIVSTIPAGCVADHYGGRWVITFGILMSSLTTMMYPKVALHGSVRLLVARLIQGFGQGLVYSSTYSLLAQWTPKSERARSIGIALSGSFVGWGVGFGLPKLFQKFMDAWEIPLYLTGTVCLFWVLVWLHFCSSKPSQSVYITDTELQYILNNREGIEDEILSKRLNVPWKAVLTSPSVWSLVLIDWAFSWVQYPMMHQLKYYAVNVLRITNDLSRSAAIFAETVTPFLSTIFWSCVSDYLVNNNYMSRTVIRKLFGVTCNMLVAPCLLAIPLAGCSSLTVFSIYEVITFNSGLHVSAIGPNPLDLSPRHAGMISGLLRTSGIVAAIFAWEFVLTMGMPSDIDRWWILYLWIIALLVILSLPYICFGSGKIQPWNFSTRGSRHTLTSRTVTSIPSRVLQ